MPDQVERPSSSHRKQLFDESSIAELLNPTRARRPGRPREDEIAERVAQLRQGGESWPSITETMNKETGIFRTEGAYRYLLRSRKHIRGPIHRNGLYPVFLRLLRQRTRRVLIVPRRRGRPHKDQIRCEATKMYRDGLKWRQIASRLNRKDSQARSPEAYRKLCGSMKVVRPWRKLDLNLIRGK